MEKPSFKLVGAPCGHHGQYTFYKAIKLTTKRERIVAIGDFFFVRIWQDSELVSIGELQLLWTDRVSDQTLVSLRLYFLPENTPDGRSVHGEDEVLAISEKVVLKAEDLLSWVSEGDDWRWGLKAVWRGACAPPSEVNHTEPLHHTKLDFSDVDKEKNAIAIEQDAPGVVVFSYPRYCRYRALVSRLEGTQGSWLRDSLVAALGGYAAPTTRTRILYCKDTFDYPDLEGHEFVCNHLAPKLKGRPRGRRRRPPRSRTQSPDSRSSDGQDGPEEKTTPRRISLRNGPDKSSDDEDKERKDIKGYKEVTLATHSPEDEAFLMQLHHFYRERNEEFLPPTLKHLSLRALFGRVASRGGYDAVCRHKLWRVLFADHPSHTKRHYERYLLQYEKHVRNGRRNGVCEQQDIPTIDVADSPDTRQHTHTPKRDIVDSETGEIKEEINMISKPAEELNREFLDSLPKEEKPAKIALIPVEKLIKNWGQADREGGSLQPGGRQDAAPAHNGHAAALDQRPRPAGRSSLRAVRVKPNRPGANTTPSSVSTSSSGSSTWSRSPPAGGCGGGGGAGGGGGGVAHNFGIHHPPPHPPPHAPPPHDDDIQEVPYKPKTPEIIDLDEYPESPQSVKKKKLDILKEGGLEVTPLPTPSWPPVLPTPITPILTPNPMLLNPVVQHQIMSNAQLFQMYNVVPNFPNGTLPPKVIQATSIFGTTSPEKTVYGNPKDPFMPPPHVIHGVPLKPQKSVQIPSTPPQDILDLTCKLTTKSAETTKATVEIVRVPTTPSPSKTSPQNLSKNYSIIDGKAVVGSNLEITLVNKNNPPKLQSQPRPTQKRSSNGKFIPKTPEKDKTPPRKNPISIPNYPVPEPSSGQPLPQVANQKESKPNMGFLDPYMALYNFAGQMDPRQLAAYRDLMTSQMKGYSNLLNMGMHPTTKN